MTVYAPGASGTAPVATITGLSLNALGVALDAAGKLYVSNEATAP